MKSLHRIKVPEITRGWGEDKRVLPGFEAVVELTIDIDKIVQHFGEKAARSKGRHSNALAGRVKLKVIKNNRPA